MTPAARRLLSVAAALAPALAAGQVCAPSPTSHEADLFGIRSLSLAMSRGTASTMDGPGTIRAGLEAVWLPHISDETARPTTCRPGKGPENVNSLAAVARGRMAIAIGYGISVEASWLPHVTLKGMRGNLVGLAVDYVRPVSPTLLVAGLPP